MNPRIETLQTKKLIGQHLTMSLSDNKTGERFVRINYRRSPNLHPSPFLQGAFQLPFVQWLEQVINAVLFERF
jgi:hypothetical protein